MRSTNGRELGRWIVPAGYVRSEMPCESGTNVRLDCFSPGIALVYPYVLFYGRRFREAEDEYRSMFAEHPKLTGIRAAVAFALWAQGRLCEAVSEFEVLEAAAPGAHQGLISVFLTSVRALCGEREPARELLRRLELRRASELVRAMDFAYLHLALREVNKAVEEMERAYENREHALMWANVSFLFDPIREHPRFQALLVKLGFG
jgi:hypothetical protein